MIQKIRNCVFIAAAALCAGGSAARAAGLVDLSFLGSTNGTTFSNNLSVTPGQVIQIEVLAQLAPSGTSNSQNVNNSITSLSPTLDGISSLKFDITNTDGGTFSNLALASFWTGGSGPSVGTNNSSTISGVRPIGAPGGLTGSTASALVLTGTFTVSNTPPASDIISGAWSSGGAGAFKINGGTRTIGISGTSESNVDPLVAYAPLTLSAVPEPASIGLLGIGAATLLMRRRRQV